jgi:2',3'-cyclic-nucleotide 2'-phosphodiesterase (5'-nucleotidase family)
MIAVANATTVSSQDTNREPNLPFGDINLVVLTDDHSWIGGHGRKEPYFNADYGDILSFYQHLKRYCDANGKDLWFVMNGDWIDGTALSLDGDIQYLAPLIEKMPFDVVNTGNHECTSCLEN